MHLLSGLTNADATDSNARQIKGGDGHGTLPPQMGEAAALNVPKSA